VPTTFRVTTQKFQFRCWVFPS